MIDVVKVNGCSIKLLEAINQYRKKKFPESFASDPFYCLVGDVKIKNGSLLIFAHFDTLYMSN